MKPCGIAVLGCGNVGKFHIRSIRELDEARLVGISGRTAERAQEVAREDGCIATADYRELLKNPEVEIVAITTPSGSHARMALEAFDAGKHVLVEKPIAMTAADADRMIARAKETGLTLGVISQRRFEEQHVAARKVLDEGKLGKLLLLEASSPYFRGQDYYDSADWRGTRKEDGGALMNQGIHSVDLMLWLGGAVNTVYGRCATVTHEIEAEDLAVVVLTYANGAFGTIMASTSIQPGFTPTIALYGEKGTIRLEGSEITHWTVPDVPKPEFEAARTTGGGVRDPMAISHEYHKFQVKDMIEAVAEKRPPVVTGADGRRAVAVVEAAYASSSSGNPVAPLGD